MKKIAILFVFVFLSFNMYAQDSSTIKVPSIGGALFLKDFPTAAKIFGLSQNGWNGYLAPGINLLYTRGLYTHYDFVATLGVTNTKYKNNQGSFYNHPLGKGDIGSERILIDLNALVNYKFLTDIHPVVPYFSGGLGVSLYDGSYVLPCIPLGGGLQFNLGKNSYLYLQTLLDLGIINTSTKHGTKENFNYSLGFSVPLHIANKAVTKAIVPIPAETDTDGDGIPDSRDKCPTVAGIAKYDGCPIPDTDGDGVNDEIDACPTIPGIARYNGCPIPDIDHDGINDEQDSCPNVAGIAKYHGCPIPDSDSDGVNDEEDKCPHEAGTLQNHGCPDVQTKMNELARFIYFKTGSSIIAPKAFGVLDQVIALMMKYPDFSLEIQGHTDNVGKPLSNKKISQVRAEAIKNYFVKKGINISRLNAVGYGMEKPIALNKTATGRALNRRVELHAQY